MEKSPPPINPKQYAPAQARLAPAFLLRMGRPRKPINGRDVEQPPRPGDPHSSAPWRRLRRQPQGERGFAPPRPMLSHGSFFVRFLRPCARSGSGGPARPWRRPRRPASPVKVQLQEKLQGSIESLRRRRDQQERKHREPNSRMSWWPTLWGRAADLAKSLGKEKTQHRAARSGARKNLAPRAAVRRLQRGPGPVAPPESRSSARPSVVPSGPYCR